MQSNDFHDIHHVSVISHILTKLLKTFFLHYKNLTGTHLSDLQYLYSTYKEVLYYCVCSEMAPSDRTSDAVASWDGWGRSRAFIL